MDFVSSHIHHLFKILYDDGLAEEQLGLSSSSLQPCHIGLVDDEVQYISLSTVCSETYLHDFCETVMQCT
jgi:hypothetical protein